MLPAAAFAPALRPPAALSRSLRLPVFTLHFALLPAGSSRNPLSWRMASVAFLVVLGCMVCAWVQGVQGQAGLTSSPFSKDPAAQEYIVQGVAGLCRDALESFGLVDGPAASALFDEPSAAISVAPNAVLVADMRNGLIRRVAAGWVQTFSGSDLGYADGNQDLAAPAHTLACCGALEH